MLVDGQRHSVHWPQAQLAPAARAYHDMIRGKPDNNKNASPGVQGGGDRVINDQKERSP
jgi:hypothetical protein